MSYLSFLISLSSFMLDSFFNNNIMKRNLKRPYIRFIRLKSITGFIHIATFIEFHMAYLIIILKGLNFARVEYQKKFKERNICMNE